MTIREAREYALKEKFGESNLLQLVYHCADSATIRAMADSADVEERAKQLQAESD